VRGGVDAAAVLE
jgi:acetyl esterase